MLDPNFPIVAADCRLVDDGTLDTVVLVRGEVEVRFGDTSEYRAEDGALDWDRFIEAHLDEIDEFCFA